MNIIEKSFPKEIVSPLIAHSNLIKTIGDFVSLLKVRFEIWRAAIKMIDEAPSCVE